MNDQDSIRKVVQLKADPAKVWHAVADAEAFGAWFGMKVDGPFVAGETVSATITEPPEHAGMRFSMHVEAMEAPSRFAYRWPPFPDSDATTLVEFRLRPRDGGTELTIVESGFTAAGGDQAAQVRERNAGGWAEQAENIRRYVEA